MIIETSANQFYRVTETGCAELSHVWNGVQVKKVRGEWIAKKSARPELVRKAATKIIEAAA